MAPPLAPMEPPTSFEPFDIECAEKPLTKEKKHWERKHVFKYLILISIVAVVVFFAAFIWTGGLALLRNEARKATVNEKHFNDFRTRFNKVYANETEKEYRYEVYTENQQKIIEMNS